MNKSEKLQDLEKKYKELGQEIEKLKAEPEEFNFWFEWRSDKILFFGALEDIFEDLFEIGDTFKEFFDRLPDELRRPFTEKMIRKHWEHINGDYKPGKGESAYCPYWSTVGSKLCFDLTSSRNQPDWFCVKDTGRCLEEVERMTKLYGCNPVKYFLWGEL